LDPCAKREIRLDCVRKALADFSEVQAELRPYKQKELVRLVLHEAIPSPDCLKLCLYGRPPEVRAVQEADSRFQTLEWRWLPGQDSNQGLSRGPQSVIILR